MMMTMLITRRTGAALAARPTTTSSPSTRGSAAAGIVVLGGSRRGYASEGTIPRDRSKPRIVVLGTGWGGYSFLKTLSSSTLRNFDVKVVSPQTSFSFTPLLAQASCATLDFRSAIEPIHSNKHMEFHHAWCDSIDFTQQRIELTSATNPQFRLSDPLLNPSGDQEKLTRASENAPPFERQSHQGGTLTYSLDYDYLVMAVGSYNATFGTKGVKENALFLKDVADARAIRWKIMSLFETANAKHHYFRSLSSSSSSSSGELSSEQEKEIRNLLSFVVVGGGPTGSEFAAELHDLITDDLAKLYPALRDFASIRLLDAGKSILSSFDKGLSEYAMKKFSRDGIEVQLHAKIARVEKDAVYIGKEAGGEERVPAGMVVWSTGITTSPLIEALTGVGKEERSGKILTDQKLNLLVQKDAKRVGGSVLDPEAFSASSAATHDAEALQPLSSVYAIGDCSSTISGALPATAQVATQKATYLAKIFNTSPPTTTPSSSDKVEEFKWENKGSMASIGSKKALIDTPANKEHGLLAWVLWRSAYTIMSMSWRNRFLVPANWASNFVFGRDVGRF